MKSILIYLTSSLTLITFFSCGNSNEPNKLVEVQIGNPYNTELSLDEYQRSYLGLYKPNSNTFNATLVNAEDSNERIQVSGAYIESENMYENQADIEKKQDEKSKVRIRGASVLDDVAINMKIMMPDDNTLVGKNFNLIIEDSVIILFSDYPKSYQLYEKQASFKALIPIKLIAIKN